MILFCVYPNLCCTYQSKIKATNAVCAISGFHAGCTKEVDAWTFTPTSSKAVSGGLNYWTLLLDSCGSDTGAYTLTGKWVCVKVFFCSFIFWYRVHGSRFSCVVALLTERGRKPLDAHLTQRTLLCAQLPFLLHSIARSRVSGITCTPSHA